MNDRKLNIRAAWLMLLLIIMLTLQLGKFHWWIVIPWWLRSGAVFFDLALVKRALGWKK